MNEFIDELIDVREKSLALISDAESALSIVGGGDLKIFFPNVYKPIKELGRFEIIGLGREIRHNSFFFSLIKSKPIEETVFYIREDYYYNIHTSSESYSHSKRVKHLKSAFIDILQKQGLWGRFIKDNSALMSMIHEKVVLGNNYRPQGSQIVFKDDIL